MTLSFSSPPLPLVVRLPVHAQQVSLQCGRGCSCRLKKNRHDVQHSLILIHTTYMLGVLSDHLEFNRVIMNSSEFEGDTQENCPTVITYHGLEVAQKIAIMDYKSN